MTTITQGLTIQVGLENGREWTGSLVQFTGGTLTVQYWGEDQPAFGLGQPVVLTIGGLQVALPPLKGSALERIELPGGRSYRFGYHLTQDFLDHIPKHLQVLFPYRASHRVRPCDENPADARIRVASESDWFEAVVLDVSTAGIGMAVSQAVEARLDASAEVEIELTFPEQPFQAAFRLKANVQHRRMKGPMIRYGVAFLSKDQQSPEAYQALEDYVVAQERKRA